jgi:hypothetical protein
LEAIRAELSTAQGRASAAAKREEEYRTQLSLHVDGASALARELEEARQKLAEAEKDRIAREHAAKYAELDVQISDSELANYAPEQIDMIGRLAKKQLKPIADQFAKRLAAQEAELASLRTARETLDSVVKTQAQMDAVASAQKETMAYESFFDQHTDPLVKGTRLAALVAGKDWQPFLARKRSASGVTFGQSLEAARRIGDKDTVAAIIREYKQSIGGSALPITAPPPGNGAAPPTASAPATKMKTSEYKQMQRDFMVVRSLPAEKWAEYKARFEAALAKNEVEDDARILQR